MNVLVVNTEGEFAESAALELAGEPAAAALLVEALVATLNVASAEPGSTEPAELTGVALVEAAGPVLRR